MTRRPRPHANNKRSDRLLTRTQAWRKSDKDNDKASRHQHHTFKAQDPWTYTAWKNRQPKPSDTNPQNP